MSPNCELIKSLKFLKANYDHSTTSRNPLYDSCKLVMQPKVRKIPKSRTRFTNTIHDPQNSPWVVILVRKTPLETCHQILYFQDLIYDSHLRVIELSTVYTWPHTNLHQQIFYNISFPYLLFYLWGVIFSSIVGWGSNVFLCELSY